MKKIQNELVCIFSILAFFVFGSILFSSCNSAKESSTKEMEEPAEEIVDVVVEEDIWIIEEHHYDQIPLSAEAKMETPAMEESASDETVVEEAGVESPLGNTEAEEQMTSGIEMETMKALEANLMEKDFEMLETVEVTEMAIPLEETQTVVAYGKKGETQATIQVITNLQTNEIEQIIFADDKHQDIYNVKAGMSGKEVKKLRKEIKHMVHKGQVFLYDDQSNVMYLMSASDMEGNEITEAELETMEVQSIIWKDKKHHKKEMEE
ncbi:hypothetical protein [Flexithrix dorotheae]|uniref:hypothetical protein n=1 Tax=Flexithrix dorotheae TaxID=70993 RepID=UPI00037A9340|nr:hypothetical protein [Flexithrix dorotheae]